MIQRVYEQAGKSDAIARLVVATDNQEIYDHVAGFGGEACMTHPDHPSGTDRCYEAFTQLGEAFDYIVNIQGDEPEIEPEQIDLLVEALVQNLAADMATLATPIRDLNDLESPSCVKVVCAADGHALYFSRAPVPFCRDLDPETALRSESPWLLHLGVYAYRREYLLQLTRQPPSRLEQLERLEQLRALEAGATIQVAVVEHRTVGIDTPEDYARFVERQQSQAA